MGKSLVLFLALFFCSASSYRQWKTTKPNGLHNKNVFETDLSTVERDITTPLATEPTITTTSPVLNPNTIHDRPETTTWQPFVTPTSPAVPGASWCIASQTGGRLALQAALDYACGKGGANCTAIQSDGNCYSPNTLLDHASYAFNDYYQKNPIPNSCNFGGTAVITSTNPSSQACQYPSTSTSSSVLDTANQNVSTVFGVGGPPTPLSSATPLPIPHLLGTTSLIFLLLRYGC